MLQLPALADRNTLLLAVSLLLIPSANAAMYKWTDEDGNTVYSQSPPPGDTPAETIKPPPKVDTEAAREQLEAQKEKADELREGRNKEAEQKRLTEEELAIEKENCRRAQANLANYQRPRGLIAQPDGSRIRLTEEERQQKLAETQKLIEEWCK